MWHSEYSTTSPPLLPFEYQYFPYNPVLAVQLVRFLDSELIQNSYHGVIWSEWGITPHMWHVFTTILRHHLISCHFIVAHHKVSIHINILSISGLFLQTMHAMKLWVIRASMGLSAYSTYIFIYCVIYCILYTVYCILYPQEATYQLPKDQMWPTWLFPLLPQSVWPTWKIFHKWQSKVFWLKGLVHMWSLVYNLVMSYLLLALCVLKSRYFIQY